MDEQLAGWSHPAARLREALEKDEFALYCQPIVALGAAERYPLAEVLVRMREEERALLPPGEFLPVFEHYGMMPQLDRWVLQHTVQQLARGSRIARFTINVSGQTLRDAAFPGFAAAQLRAAGLELVASFAHVLAEAGMASFWSSAIDTYRKLLAKAGAMSEAEADAWAAALRSDSDARVFFGSSNYYAYVARRP